MVFDRFLNFVQSKRTWGRTAMEPSTSERPAVSDELQQQIARLAFQLYEARGREDGHDVEDWLQAEAALRRDTLLPKASIAAAVYED